MDRTMVSVLILLVVMFVSPVFAERPTLDFYPDPALGGVGIDISVKFTFGLANNTWPVTRVYFARLDAEGEFLTAGELVASNWFDKGQAYLLNAEPGRYVAVGAMVRGREQSQGMSVSSSGGITPMMTIGDRFEFPVVFPEEMVRKTEVVIEPGRIAFLGKFKTKDDDVVADRVQAHFLPLIDPQIVDELGGEIEVGKTEVPALVLKKVSNDEYDALSFWRKARNQVFHVYPVWQQIAIAEMDALPR